MSHVHEIELDLTRSLVDDPRAGHNRWHPDIPAVLRCAPGDTVALRARDGYDGQISRNSTAADVLAMDAARIHPLTGPVFIEGAEPGDLLVVDVLSVETGDFGATLNIPGFGFLRDEFTEPHIVRWEIADGFATSVDLPGVRLPGAPFMGVMGVAPSRELFERNRSAEHRVAKEGGLVELPNPTSSVPPDLPGDPARRTISPTEAGGNIDIKHLTAGSRVYLRSGLRAGCSPSATGTSRRETANPVVPQWKPLQEWWCDSTCASRRRRRATCVICASSVSPPGPRRWPRGRTSR